MRNKDLYKRMTLKDLQNVELEMLILLDEFCKKNGLKYYLAGGTLIGAVRHAGFIPWDDDIDVLMPRPDCDRMMDILSNGIFDEHHKVESFYINPNSWSPIIRIYDTRTKVAFKEFRRDVDFGCWLDIFPLDGLESDEAKRKRHYKKMRILTDLHLCCLTKFGVKRRSRFVTIAQYALLPLLPIIRLPRSPFYMKMLQRAARIVNYDDAEYVGALLGRGIDAETLRKNQLEPSVDLQFDNHIFTTMGNYKTYLNNMYGNYMELPPEEERVSRHIIEAYWLEQVDGE